MSKKYLFSIVCVLVGLGEAHSANSPVSSAQLLKSYEGIQRALAGDQLEQGRRLAAQALEEVTNETEASRLKMREGLQALTAGQSDPETRKAFGVYSEGATQLVRADQKLKKQWQLFYCPMVPKDTYRFWIQVKGSDLQNPYYGAKMLTCGVKKPW